MSPEEILNHSIKFDDSYFSSGVYFIFIHRFPLSFKDKRLVYIGSGKNMKNRVMNPKHPYRLLHDRLSDNYMVSCTYYSCLNYIEIEKECIKYFKPFLNKNNK